MKGFIRSEAEFTSLHIQATVIQTERYMLFFVRLPILRRIMIELRGLRLTFGG